jgi:hypothetical protein
VLQIAEIAGITLQIAVIWPFSRVRPPQYCRRSRRYLNALRVIRPRIEGFQAMIRSPGAVGFNGRTAPVASSRLIDAVAASLAIGSLSLCLIVALTMLSIKVSMAMPIPA